MKNKISAAGKNPKGMTYSEKLRWAKEVELYVDNVEAQLAEMQRDRDTNYRNMQDFFRQINQDLTMVVLGRVFDFGSEKCYRFADELSKMWVKFADVWNGDTADMEYSHDDLDRSLKEILGDRFVPYEQRYEGLLLIHNKNGDGR